jgi:dipeptidyl aminopeptidase/acylaminoacyl peptidase
MRKILVFFAAALLLQALSTGEGPRVTASIPPQVTPRVTIDKMLSAPFPSGLVAAPSGGKVAWVQDAEGVRNIWVAEPPAFQGRKITSYSKDDGQEITQLTFTPDAKTVIFVRGGPPNRFGVIPNPTSDPSGQTQVVWRVSIDGGEPARIGEGHTPSVSPNGTSVAYISRGQIFSAPTGGSGEPKPMVKLEGGPSSLRWSPDGSKLAFVSNRRDHGFIGIYEVSAGVVHYLDPSVDQDEEPVWSPDGKRIAFLRIASEDRTLFLARRAGQPWSIVVADPATGHSKTIWTAANGAGSVFHQVLSENQLLWGAGDRLVFPWERDGWVHLYSIAAQGGSTTLLTPGAFEVEYVTLSRDRREVMYNSNQDDVDRRHLWRASVADGKPKAITQGSGIEWSPVATSEGESIAFARSSARVPAHVVISSGSGGTKDLASGSIPRDFPEADLVDPQQVIISSADGIQVHGQLFLPPHPSAGRRYAALLFFHGGPVRQMLLGFHYMDYYHNTYAMNQYLASRGFIVLSVNYRCGIGYGMEFREPINGGAGGASEFNDVMGAGLYLRNRSDVDPNRIGLWGGSYGGYLTAQGLARASDVFKAGVDFHGAHDWNVVINNFIPSYNPLEHPDIAKLAFESSPLSAVGTWRSPVLLISGDDDRNVPISETVNLVRALREHNVEVEQLILPDEVHDILLHSNLLRAYHATAEFLERKLMKSEASSENRH